MSCYGCLALLLYMCEPSCLGPHSLGFPPPRNLPPTISVLSHKMISTSYPNVVDLVKLDLVHMKMSLFTHEGVKSSSYDDPFSHDKGFYSYFWNLWTSLPIYSPPKCKKTKINIPLSYMLILEYHRPPLPNVAYPQETVRIELKSFLSSSCRDRKSVV